MSNSVRLGLVGLGGMGQHHATNILSGKVNRLTLAAVADMDFSRTAMYPSAKPFASLGEMAASGAVDAVLIATPHYQHTSAGIQALEAGLHVMMEKPISAHKADAEKMLAAHTAKNQVFAAMFNQRTDDYFRQIRHLVKEGDLGEVRRINWIITDWYRTAKYYASGGWRATWAGEGGGVLLNQCPHNLDLLQWIFGQPSRVRAFCGFGKYHSIEVEDDVTAYLEFPNGATGVFVTSTGEAPGTNRLEVVADGGRVVYEQDRLLFTRNAVSMSEYSKAAPDGFSRPKTEEIIVPTKDHGGQHVAILQNFVDAILDGVPLVAPARDGLASLELANAMLLSAWTDAAVDLPMDGRLYEEWLNRKIAASPLTAREADAPH